LSKLCNILGLLILSGCATFGESGFLPKDPSAAGDVGLAEGLNTLIENAPANPADLTGWIIAALAAGGAGSAGAVKVLRDRKKNKTTQALADKLGVPSYIEGGDKSPSSQGETSA